MLQAPVDCFGGAVGGTGAVEVGQDVGGSFGQGPGQCLDLLQPVGDGLPQGVDEPLHQVLSQTRLLGAVGLDQALVDAPGGLDRGVALIGEQGLEALGLDIGEQVGPGHQGASGPVELVTRPAPPARDRSLDAAARHWSSLLAARTTTRVGVHPPPGPVGVPRRWRSRDPVKPPRGYHLDPPAPGLAPSGEPGLEGLLGPAWDHVQQAGRTTAVAQGGSGR